MSKFIMHFPKDFRWGSATAAHQVEGGNTNNQWWQWEQSDGHILNNDKSGLACDWWNNAERDFDLMAQMGLNAHRLSVEWSRIEPREGVFDDAAIGRYREMLLGLRQRGIEPMVTLHHFTNPIWLEEQGGWENDETAVPAFERFVRHTVSKLKDLCDLWCTVNEPNVYATTSYLAARTPPAKLGEFDTTLAVLRNMLLGHAAAYHAIHQIQPYARVGLAHHIRPLDGLRDGHVLDGLIARVQSSLFNDAVLQAVVEGKWNRLLAKGAPSPRSLKNTADWIGVNYYTRQRTKFDRHSPSSWYGTILNTPNAEESDFDYGEIYPHGFMRAMRQAAKYKLPLYITENGLPDHDDDQRPRFLVTHLREMWQGIQMCYYVQGYYHWSFVDNFEWSEGWRMKFGLYELDHATQERKARRSADLYAAIVKANAITSEMVRVFTPELMHKLFP